MFILPHSYFGDFRVNKIKEMIKIKFCFPEIKPSNREELIDSILKEIKENKFIGYAGFRKKKYLRNYLNYRLQNFKSKNYQPNTKKKQKKIEKLIRKTINLCERKLKLVKIYIFIFPWFPQKRDKSFKGITGFAPYKNVINLYLYSKNFDLKSLQQVIVHEYNHLAFYFYQKFFEKKKVKWRIIDSLVMEGLAQNFEEEILKTRPIYSKALSQKEAFNLLKKIKDKLYEIDYKFANALFFGNKRFKKWSGYTVGYFIVKNFRNKNKNLKWRDLILIPSEKIYSLMINLKNYNETLYSSRK